MYKLNIEEYRCPIEIGVTTAMTTWWHLNTGLGFLLRVPYNSNTAILLYNTLINTENNNITENISEQFEKRINK